MGSREDVAARIEADTRQKVEEMNRAVNVNKESVGVCNYTFISRK